MNIIDFLSAPWALMPEKLLELQAIYAMHFRGEKIDIAAIEARLGRPLANEQQEYEVRDGGVAVLSISGVISPKANIMTRVSGGASAQMLSKQVASMQADHRVRGVVLDFDTPGGSVLGIPALGEAIRALAADKPTVSVCTGQMCSAGYWTGSAANSVYISGLTDYVGSIGVVATHSYDPRQANVQTTEVTAGKYKRMASDNAPLSEEGKAYIQNQVDQIYGVFVDTVAQNRKVKAEQVIEKMADGRVFIGQQAIDAGLVDGVSSVEAMVEKLATNPQQYASRRKAVFALGAISGGVPEVAAEVDEPVLQVESENLPKGNAMNPQELAAQFAAENAEACALIRAEGAAAERARIQAVREQGMVGHEALIEAMAFDGKSTAADAALAIVAAEKAKGKAAADARAADAPAVVPTDAVGDEPAAVSHKSDRAKLDADAKAYMAANPGTDYVSAIKIIQKGA